MARPCVRPVMYGLRGPPDGDERATVSGRAHQPAKNMRVAGTSRTGSLVTCAVESTPFLAERQPPRIWYACPHHVSPTSRAPLRKSNFAVTVEGECREKVCQAVARGGVPHGGDVCARLLERPGQCQATRGDRVDVRKRIGARSRFYRPARGLLEAPQADERHRPRGEHAVQHRVERAEVTRVVGRAHGRVGVPDNRVNEGEVIVTEREVRAQFDRPRERADRFVGLTRSMSARPIAQWTAGSRSSAMSPCAAARYACSMPAARSLQFWKASWKCVNESPAYAREKVGSRRSAVSKKCRACSLSAWRYWCMCQRPRWCAPHASNELGGFRMARFRSRGLISLATDATMRLPISSRTMKASSKGRLKTSVQTIRALRVSEAARLFRADSSLVQ